MLPNRVPVKFGYNPSSTGNLPLGLAIDKGYYAQAGLDVTVTVFPGAANAYIPSLAKGDLDIIAANASSSLLNARSGGFDVQLFLPTTADKVGYTSTFGIMARPELVDSGRLNAPQSLKGLHVDGLAQGTWADYLMGKLVADQGLSGQVKLSYLAKTPPDLLSLMSKGAVDVSPQLEPLATQMETQGIAKKWKTGADIAPGVPSGYLIGSGNFLGNNRCAAVAFARATQKATADILASQGQWTPQLVDETAKITKLSKDTIQATGHTPYFVTDPKIDPKPLQDLTSYFKATGLLAGNVDINALINNSVSDALSK